MTQHAAIPKTCRPFLLPPDTEKRPPRLPHHKSQTLNRPEPQLASIVRKAPSIPRQNLPQPSPGILTPHRQSAPRAPSFPPQRHKGDRAGRLGRVPVLSFQNHSAARRLLIIFRPNATRATTSSRSTWEGRELSSPIFPQGAKSLAARSAQRGFLHARGRLGN